MLVLLVGDLQCFPEDPFNVFKARQQIRILCFVVGQLFFKVSSEVKETFTSKKERKRRAGGFLDIKSGEC